MSRKIGGIEKPELQEIPQIKERISYLYVERCLISRQDSAISVIDKRGTVNIPAASLSVLLLGPGTNVTHRAIELIGEVGTCVIWVGENCVRFYAIGRAMTHSASLLIQQAKLVSNTQSRLAVARKMYQMRFPSEDVSQLTMQQLRGKEGARVRKIYRECSKKTGVEWNGREYDPEDYSAGTPVNQALSAGNVCLYGLAHSVIAALGCSPGLGFVHTGHDRAFVYDIADLYKAEFVIPLAFSLAAQNLEDIGGEMRRKMRDLISQAHLLEKMTKDVHMLITGKDYPGEISYASSVSLWDDKKGNVKNGISYGKELDQSEEIR
jgi:CRISPR-associated protein Cas1